MSQKPFVSKPFIAEIELGTPETGMEALELIRAAGNGCFQPENLSLSGDKPVVVLTVDGRYEAHGSWPSDVKWHLKKAIKSLARGEVRSVKMGDPTLIPERCDKDEAPCPACVAGRELS